jgi:predicted secreted hydrolase
VIGLHWIWLHVRLAGERELVAYVVRDTRTEVARAAWEIDRDAAVSLIPTFELRVLESAETAHGAIAVRVELGWGQHRLTLEHAVRSPYIRMRAFGDVLDLGIYEGPVRAVNGVGCEGGWLEVMPSFRPSR